MVRTENGTKLPAIFRSGKFDEWRERERVDVPKVVRQSMPLKDLLSRSGVKRQAPNPSLPRKKAKVHHLALDDLLWKSIPRPTVSGLDGDAKPLDKLRGDHERRVRYVNKKR